MSHQFTPREVALLMAHEIDHQESAPEDDEYIGDWAPTHSCGGAGDPTCAACWMHSYDRAAGVVAEEPEWEYVPGWIAADGRARISQGVIAPSDLSEFIAEGGDVVRRRVSRFEAVTADMVPVKQEGADNA